MTVGIVGQGRMGTALASALRRAGVAVATAPGRGDPATVTALLGRATALALALPFPVALTFAEGPAGRLGRGRTLIDLSNPTCTRSAVPADRSGGELLAEAAVSWRVAKAFNTVPAGLLEHCEVAGVPVTIPVATDHAAARREVSALADRLGFVALDAGGIGASRQVEALAVLLMGISDRQQLGGRVAIHVGVPVQRRTAQEVSCHLG